MVKRFFTAIVILFFMVNIYGCVAILAGAAGGVGTAVWLKGKLSQEVNASYEKSTNGAREGINSLRLKIRKETVKDDVAQFICEYTDGRQVWVDVRKISDSTSKIEVRVGAAGDKEAARKILNKILRYI